MTVLADFAEILGNQGRSVGVAGAELPAFNTGGRLTGHRALLLFLASNLEGSAAVFINNQPVGAVFPTGPVATSTQMLSFPGTVLKDGNNVMSLRSVTDPFNIRNVICFYHQDSD
jgi:hypothetical protein